MTVRRATKNDIEQLADSINEVQELHVTRLPRLFRPARRQDWVAYFREVLKRPGALVFVACSNGEVVGHLVLVSYDHGESAFTHASRLLHIESIGVNQAYRRQGFGTELLEMARAVARELRVDRIELDTWEFNESARAFFRAHGFETLSIHMTAEV